MATPGAVLLDIDGVLTTSWEPIDGAAKAVARIRSGGLAVAFVTNTTSLSRARIAELLEASGIPVRPDEVVTAARAAAAYLTRQHPGSTCLFLNAGSVGEDLDGIHVVGEGEWDADVVLTGGAGPSVGYAELNAAFRLLLDGAPLVAMQRNFSWQTAEGPHLDMGAFVTGLEQAAHVQATVIGKPSPSFFAAVLAELGVTPSEAVMVGDDIDADVVGAQASGITGVLVRTGKFRSEVLERAASPPDHVIDSIADLPALLELPEDH